jgi:hypothetical protein
MNFYEIYLFNFLKSSKINLRSQSHKKIDANNLKNYYINRTSKILEKIR